MPERDGGFTVKFKGIKQMAYENLNVSTQVKQRLQESLEVQVGLAICLAILVLS